MFIKEGAVSKTKSDFTDPSERYLFMCSDVLLISQVSLLDKHLPKSSLTAALKCIEIGYKYGFVTHTRFRGSTSCVSLFVCYTNINVSCVCSFLFSQPVEVARPSASRSV